MKNVNTLAAIFVALLLPISSWAQKKDESKSDKKIYGSATILTNYIDKGITQSDKNFALQAGFGYQMGPQARIGVWGSSVKLPSDSESVNLRLYFDVKIEFTTNSTLVLRYDFNRYYSSDAHNGNLLNADFQTFGYHVLMEQNTNWEGTTTAATWYGFSKEFNLPYSLLFKPQLGYSQLAADGYSNYFDARAGLGTKFADVFYELSATLNSNASQFNGRGETAFALGIYANF